MNGIDFFFNKEDDASSQMDRFYGSFYAKRVNVLMAQIADPEKVTNVVDRGHVLLQREAKADYLRLVFYRREGTSEHARPLLILPIGFIAPTKMEAAKSPTNQDLTMGRIRFYTRCTVDLLACLDPMVLTVYMDLHYMDWLNGVLCNMRAKYPNQDLFFNPEDVH